ncbi:hypothetical protein HanPI659440_Chr00c31g0737371 [Helianthus annuus]|nr:hypothetical protein HanPI659440_Chr00c31g0737371 [Helianthus annuus]
MVIGHPPPSLHRHTLLCIWGGVAIGCNGVKIEVYYARSILGPFQPFWRPKTKLIFFKGKKKFGTFFPSLITLLSVFGNKQKSNTTLTRSGLLV